LFVRVSKHCNRQIVKSLMGREITIGINPLTRVYERAWKLIEELITS
jgi:hypothetical protein